jgi:GAF domain-containing protein
MARPPAWSTWQLAEFLEVVAAFETEESAALGAVERAAEALDAEVAAILSAGQVVASIGYPAGEVPLADLRAVAYDAGRDMPVPGAGRCPAVRVSLDYPDDATLVLARSGTGEVGRDEMSLLRGMARVTSMTMRTLRLFDDERAARDELQVLLDEQAALRRVAILVANGVPQNDMFAAVAAEAGRLADADFAQVIRYEPPGVALTVAVWGTQPGGTRVGTRYAPSDHDVSATVLRTGEPARADEPPQIDEPAQTAAPARMNEPARVGHPAHMGKLTNDTVRAATAIRPAAIRSTVGIPIVVDGGLWGAVITGTNRPTPMPKDTEQRISGFTELAATAISNAQAREELAASRSRAVVAADETRRRLGRELHDGVQQRLASLALTLRMAEVVLPHGSDELGSVLSQAATQLQEVFQELQAMARDLHPSILSQGGLAPALRMICNRSTVPVELDLDVDRRLPDPVETAAFYIVSAGLANAVKHAPTSTVRVGVKLTDRSLRVDVRDDGVGGADVTRESGLVGLRDRVAALGGTITVVSPPGDGTAIVAEVPIDDR